MAYVWILLLAVVLGFWLGFSLHPWIGWAVFGTCIVGGVHLGKKAFSDRVEFKRRYHTR